MKDHDVVESLNNAWRALCRQYGKQREESLRMVLNLLSKIIGEVESGVRKSHMVQQITIEEWMRILNEEGVK